MAAAESHIERDEEVAVFISCGTKSELMIIAGDPPLVADGHILIDDIVAIPVDQFRQLGSLHDIDILAGNAQAQRLVQAGGEELETDLAQILRICIGNQPDFAAARAGQQFTVGPHCQAADFKNTVLRHGQRHHFVILRFRVGILGCARGSSAWEIAAQLFLEFRRPGGLQLRGNVYIPAALNIADLDE